MATSYRFEQPAYSLGLFGKPSATNRYLSPNGLVRQPAAAISDADHSIWRTRRRARTGGHRRCAFGIVAGFHTGRPWHRVSGRDVLIQVEDVVGIVASL